MLSCWRCRLTALFFLFRVCVKKSTQERLALKILIDRPKARNEVRGNIVTLLSDDCCLWLRFQSVCCHLPFLLSPSLPGGFLRFAIVPHSTFYRCSSHFSFGTFFITIEFRVNLGGGHQRKEARNSRGSLFYNF